MTKVVLILLAALVFEAVGVVFVSGGLKEIQGAREMTVSEIARVARGGVTNPKILLGVFLMAIFFGMSLYLLSSQDVSLIWPLTSLGFVMTTLAAKFFLHERVSGVRWAGVILIVLGATLGVYSEQTKDKKPDVPHAEDATRQ
jgi:multidrug transporter EmrE-like cation transporter